ncbi:insulin-degrading enzyme-like 1, peroxisomal isoform X2 [Hevea brasiliensis]|uniref:insulin-degrading enzyme-like 1, peroxisomal isoform X2 n=1 Tax=Hevea brasiliensis TaxID=3981 RepID=UPI0025EA4137|nr:insulin-degrading enzyme-like 1, peroxisomal isoform X2 [Hevea brasiliensis]
MATEVEVEIVKPHTDKREYRRIVLKNSLEVLLISDPDTDKSAASMDVGVGYSSDPVGLEGLAHFLEHMLFYASEKYPMEGSYSEYILENGGQYNAYTSYEHTNYHFEVNSDCFEEALDRFAQFFLGPLLSADATMREIKAVDSENEKNLLSDGWRMPQLQKHLSDEKHPYHKFGTGNWETLEVQPKAKGLDTRHELIKFYEENYSANLMHLVIYAKENLNAIQSIVEDKFQEIRSNNRDYISFPGQPCTSKHLQILVKAVPIEQGHKLRIVWPITPSILHYKEGPCNYLSHLIGHEGEGSLFSILKSLGWATSLYANEDGQNREFSFFKVTIDLTDDGHEHMQDVVALLFKYIHLLQESGVRKWIFDELAGICETNFHYQDKISPIYYAIEIASNMQLYPPKDWLVQSSMPSKFSPSIIQSVMNQLSPTNARIFWVSKEFEGQTDLVEPWYKTAYSVEDITDSMIQEWISSAPNENLHLPAPNMFIPTDLLLKDTGTQEKVKFPVLVRKSSYASLWYKPDTRFSTPKAYVKIDFNCPFAKSSPEAEVLTVIFTQLLEDYLNEYAYHASVAGLYYDIYMAASGFQEKLRKDYENNKFEQPYEQAMYYCYLLLCDQKWPWMEKLEVLPHLEAEDLIKFTPMMLSRAFLECYIAGNIECSEAESIIQYVEDVFFKGPNPICQPLFPSQHLTNRVIKLERGMSYVYPIKGLNPSNENSALVHYIQVHQDEFMLNVKLQLFTLIATQPTFQQLRTVEQLGYITHLTRRNDYGIRGLQFIVQSTVKDPGYIDLRVEAFLRLFENKIYEMTDVEFKSNVKALIDTKLEKHKNLWEESGFYWHEIVVGTLKFDRIECEVAALERLTKQEFVDFFDEYIRIGAPQKRTLSIRVYGSLHSLAYTSDTGEQAELNKVQIEDIYSFRRSQALHSSFKGSFGRTKL